MARPVWSGSLSVGLVTVGVRMYSATGDHNIHFHQFERGTSDRIRYRRVNERTGEEVSYENIVSGYPMDGSEHVIVEPEELEQIAPGKSRNIDIDAFVSLGEIDPVYFSRSYWLVPSSKDFNRPYSLLRQAMAETDRAAVARFVMRNREHLAAIRAGDNLLVLTTLLFAEDVRDPAEQMDSLPEKVKPRSGELDMAENLIESMSQPWRPEDYRDTYTDRIRELIEDKRAGRSVVTASEPPEPTKVVDLFDALSRSVAQHAGKRTGKRSRSAEETPDVSELPKAELEKLARKLEIRGRSKLNRQELERAVESASRQHQRAS